MRDVPPSFFHSLEQRHLDHERDEAVRQPEERKKQRVPERCMNIISVEMTGVFKKASREAADGGN